MARTPITTIVPAGKVRLALHEWPGDPPTIFLVHAAGMHGRCWDAVVAELPGRRCVAVDIRGHGYSDCPPPPYAWSALGDDLVALLQARRLQQMIGVGHSLGGHLVTQAAAALPEHFQALLLIEPVIFPRHYYGHTLPEEHFTARRRNRWPSPQAMFERFAERIPYASWDRRVLWDYCQHALRRDATTADGQPGYVLACPPAVEASLYATGLAPDADIYDRLGQIQVPVWVMRADSSQAADAQDMRRSPTAPDLAQHFPQGQDEHLPEYTHFLPMENPGLVAQRIKSLIDKLA